MAESWKTYASDFVIDWLLEEDKDNAPVRYLALRDLMGSLRTTKFWNM